MPHYGPSRQPRRSTESGGKLSFVSRLWLTEVCHGADIQVTNVDDHSRHSHDYRNAGRRSVARRKLIFAAFLSEADAKRRRRRVLSRACIARSGLLVTNGVVGIAVAVA